MQVPSVDEIIQRMDGVTELAGMPISVFAAALHQLILEGKAIMHDDGTIEYVRGKA